MFIPKGTCVYYNVFAMSRDPAVYQNADEYYPERFAPKSDEGYGEPFLQGPFGFGRRYRLHLSGSTFADIVGSVLVAILRKRVFGS